MKDNNINSTRVFVRYNEVDKQGIVHNSVYYIWFEIARWQFAKNVLNIVEQDLENHDVFVIVYESSCKYLVPAKFNDTLIVEVLFEETKSSRFTLHYKIKREDDDKLIATGKTTHAFTRRNGRLLLNMPDFFRESLEKALQKYSNLIIKSE
jgi:acyl-CoA thioester hydrolase